jgi:hypothetical protein
MEVDNRGLNGPLTAKQLIRILLIAGVIVAVILLAIHSQRGLDRAEQVVKCSENAPVGWPCDRLPTGYPGE